MDGIWYSDLPHFARSVVADPTQFIPDTNTTLTKQLNAVFLFSVYFYVIIILLGGNGTKTLIFPIIVGLATFAIHERSAGVKVRTVDRLAEAGLEVDPVVKRVCSKPTKQNPFMNVLPTDYANGAQRRGASDVSRPSVAARVDKMYNVNASVEETDIYGRNTGIRQFYSNPSTTIPNDQSGFAKWLYGEGRGRQ